MVSIVSVEEVKCGIWEVYDFIGGGYVMVVMGMSSSIKKYF